MNRHTWSLRIRALLARRRVERELDEEIAFHIDREVQKLIDEGLPEADARATARARFGSVPRTADECRDARGVGAIDNLLRDIRYALRGFARAPLVALTVIVTVGLGLGLIAAAFTLLNVFLFRVDRVPDVHEMVEVQRLETSDEGTLPWTYPRFEALGRDTQVFSGTYAEFPEIDSQVEGRTVTGTLVTSTFFDVLRVQAALGRALLPDDHQSRRLVMVLSHRGWERLFGRNPGVLGRRLIVNELPFEIIGVMPEGFRGLEVGPPDYWASFSLLGDMLPAHLGREADANLRVIGRLRPDVTAQGARTALAMWDASQPTAAAVPTQASDIVLMPRRGTVPQPLEAVLLTAPLFFAFGLILLTGCANVANLLLARGVARQREIGIRLSIGATRGRIVRQLLTESLLLALGGALVGYVVSRLVLMSIINGITSTMPANIGDIRLRVPEADWRVLLFLLIGAAVSTICFGLIPALQATRIEPVRTIRGEILRDARPGRARNMLIGMQVSASALLLICAVIFLRSTFTAVTEDPGVRISDTLIVQVASEPTRPAVVEAVTGEASVAVVAAAWPDVLATSRPVSVEAGRVRATLACRFVSPEYFSVLDIAVVRGRSFLPEERTTKLSVAVVSETTARTLWPDSDALGQVVRVDQPTDARPWPAGSPSLESRTFTVVGVVKDVPGFRISPLDAGVVYVPTTVDISGTSLVARVHGDPERARQALRARLTPIDPNMATMVGSMVWITRMVAYFLRVAFWLTMGLGALALALTVSGLFGVLSYLVERRSREIGIRMALGAAAADVTRLILWQTFRPVAAGLAVGALAAAGLAALLLATPAAGGLAEIVRVRDPLSYLVATLVIVTACSLAALIPASRAARLDPTRALRQE